MKQSKLMMILVAVFGLLCVIFAVFFFSGDRTSPIIHFSSAEITYRQGDPESVLLSDVQATDNKDGDITDQVVIDKLVPIDTKNKAMVHYVVMDRSGNIGTASRTISYYEEEKTVSTEPVLSPKPSPTPTPVPPSSSPNPVNPTVPVLTMVAKSVEIGRDEEPYLLDYVKSISDDTDTKEDLYQAVSIVGEVEFGIPGTYELTYYVTDSSGNDSLPQRLSVIVK
ncbi:MAG: DUF5011 domain-containing protein [Oscillospiraceae bacterium]